MQEIVETRATTVVVSRGSLVLHAVALLDPVYCTLFLEDMLRVSRWETGVRADSTSLDDLRMSIVPTCLDGWHGSLDITAELDTRDERRTLSHFRVSMFASSHPRTAPE